MYRPLVEKDSAKRKTNTERISKDVRRLSSLTQTVFWLVTQSSIKEDCVTSQKTASVGGYCPSYCAFMPIQAREGPHAEILLLHSLRFIDL